MKRRAEIARALLMLLAAFVAAASVRAAEPAAEAPAAPGARRLRIRVVSIQRIVESSERRKEGLAAIKKRYELQSKALEKAGQRLKDKAADLRGSSLNRKGFTYREKVLSLDLMRLGYEREAQSYVRQVEADQLKLKEVVLKEVLAFIRAYAEKNGIDIVMQKGILLPPREVRGISRQGVIGEVGEMPMLFAIVASEAADITDAVIESLNRAHRERTKAPDAGAAGNDE